MKTCFCEEKHKAGYKACPVAREWAGAVHELLAQLGRGSESREHKTKTNKKRGPTDQRTFIESERVDTRQG